MQVTSEHDAFSFAEVARLKKRLADLETIAAYRAAALETMAVRVEELTAETTRLNEYLRALDEANRNLRKTLANRGKTA